MSHTQKTWKKAAYAVRYLPSVVGPLSQAFVNSPSQLSLVAPVNDR